MPVLEGVQEKIKNPWQILYQDFSSQQVMNSTPIILDRDALDLTI